MDHLLPRSRKRGRQNQPCPDVQELRAAHAFDPRPFVIATQIGAGVKQVRRWLGEIGLSVEPPRKQRSRDVTPPYIWGANRTSDGKRVTCTLYNIWHSMRLRCRTPGYRDYKYYGGRGITICAEWNEYAPFRAWALSRGFGKALSIDRIDPNGNYEDANCRWVSQSLQQDNTRRVIKLTVCGVTKPLPEWARLRGLPPDVLRARVQVQGWSHDDAVLIPLGAGRPGVLRGRAAAKAKRLANEITPRR